MDDKRVFFRDEAARNQFFQDVFNASGVLTWSEFYSAYGLVKTTCEYYRNGSKSIPEPLFTSLLNTLTKEQQDCYAEAIYYKPLHWGQSLGGEIATKLHPEIYQVGREIGLQKLIAIAKAKSAFDSTMPLNEELCEFIGAFIGDGFTNKYGHAYWIQFAGDRRLDGDYFSNVLSKYAKSLFGGAMGHTKFRKGDNSMYLSFHSKSLFELLTKRFGFPAGLKVYSTKIPDEILSADKKYLYRAIRGIFDTDGCVFLDRRKVYSKPYPRIVLQTVSKDLYLQLKHILENEFTIYTLTKKPHGFGTHISYALEIYGHKQFQKWMSIIGFSNKKHLDRCSELTSLRRELHPRPVDYQSTAPLLSY